MAVAAANKLFREHAIDPQSIDFLLLCTQTPDYPLPTTACLLQERETHLHGSADEASLNVQASHVSPGHVGVDSDHAENAGPAKSACLKACGDDSQTIVKSASSVDLTGVAMAPPTVPGGAPPTSSPAQRVQTMAEASGGCRA
mgnify:CR=1 FL=1